MTNEHMNRVYAATNGIETLTNLLDEKEKAARILGMTDHAQSLAALIWHMRRHVADIRNSMTEIVDDYVRTTEQGSTNMIRAVLAAAPRPPGPPEPPISVPDRV